MESEASITPSEIVQPETKNTVQRVVLLEDFTSWNCPPCATLNPLMSAGVDKLGYNVVAPALYHVWWPNYDDDPVYQYNIQEATDKVGYYGCNYVPWYMLDGKLTATPGTQAAVESGILARAAVPANMTIWSQGYVSGTTGSVTAKVTAVENIAKTDLRLYVMLWESNITRALWNYRTAAWDSPPYPNGETEMDWAVWDMIPNDKGTAIWPTGAIIGDTVEMTFPLTLDPSWNLNELGVTIFVQSWGTKNVEQARVETFDNFPPVVTINAPPSGTAEQVLSGTIPITWTATDTEDPANTLDISIDYSADGGSTWTNIMTGTDNNIAPYTYNWNTVAAGIPDGPGYRVRVKATDSKGDYHKPSSSEAFSIDNTIDDKWYLQIETTGTNMDLNMKPVENTRQSVSTAGITAGGQWMVGKWDTTQTFTDKNINGAWTFNVYGKTPDEGYNPLVGYLYAKVFTSSNTATPLYTTALDNENVGAFQTTHLFSWTETLSGTIVNGDQIIVEIWVSASAGTYPAVGFMNANNGFNSSAASWTFKNYTSNSDGLGTAAGNYVATNGNPGGYVNVVLTPPGSGAATQAIRCGYWETSFNTGCLPTDPKLSLDWRCFSVGTDQTYTYAYAFIDTTPGIPSGGTTALIAASEWNYHVTATTAWTSVAPIDISSVVNADTTYYLKIVFRTALSRGVGTYNLGFDNAKVTWTQASPKFYAEFDYGLTQSHVVPTLGSGGGPVPAVYNIPLTGKTANSWVFVSFPIAVSGNIQTILNDAALGDSGTTWTIAKWYNPATPNDPWKTYRVGGTANDLTTINNQMGVWLWITSNGGNQMLTTGVTGLYPTSTVLIHLEAGWNLVGYPSATSKLASVALTGTGADRVAYWQASSPYITDTTNLASVTMSQGNAYWVHVNSATDWSVGVL